MEKLLSQSAAGIVDVHCFLGLGVLGNETRESLHGVLIGKEIAGNISAFVLIELSSGKGLEFFLKFFIYYMHERFWQWLPAQGARWKQKLNKIKA